MYGAHVERGIITFTDNGMHTVKSFCRDGLSISGLPAIGGAIFNIGDRVYFFIFDDGTGLILDKF